MRGVENSSSEKQRRNVEDDSIWKEYEGVGVPEPALVSAPIEGAFSYREAIQG